MTIHTSYPWYDWNFYSYPNQARGNTSFCKTDNFVLSFIVSVYDSIITQMTMKYFKLPKR